MHPLIATAPGGALLLLRPGDELEVDEGHTHIQRSVRNGDLVKVARPRVRAPGEWFSSAADALPGSGPPAVFGDPPLFDPGNPGPRSVEAKQASR